MTFGATNVHVPQNNGEMTEGFFMPGDAFTSHKWCQTGEKGYVVHGGLFGKPRFLKEGSCITTGGIFGKARFVKTITPTPSPGSTPVMQPTPGSDLPKMDLH